MSLLSALRAAPVPAVVLGFGGLIPFVGLALLVAFVPVPWYAFWLGALSFYGALILSFVGALQWGYAVRSGVRGARAWMQYGWSVLPCLIGWLSLHLPVWTALRIQAVALLACYSFDRIMARADALPEWMLPLRAVLTAVGAGSLLFASLV